MLQWLKDNQALVILAWPVLTALLSLVYAQLDRIPRVHAVMSVMVSLGIDLPKMWEALGRIVKGNPPGSSGTGKTLAAAGLSVHPPAPTVLESKRTAGILRQFIVCLMLAIVTVTTGTGCAAWQYAKDHPVEVAKTFVQYAELFLQSAMSVWNMIAPLLGTNATAASDAFNKAVVTAQNSIAILLDAVKAADAAGKPAPDLGALITNVQDAIARVMAIVAQYKSAAPGIGAEHGALEHQAAVIAAWKR